MLDFVSCRASSVVLMSSSVTAVVIDDSDGVTIANSDIIDNTDRAETVRSST